MDFVNRKDTRNSPRSNLTQRHTTKEHKCTRCGKGPHFKQNCPATDVTYYRCGKKGHFAAKCFSRTIAAVFSQDELELAETSYLDAVASRGTHVEARS